MTIAISIKVNDGAVLATDSASTLIGQDEAGNTVVVNIYENANKIFNINKKIPVGVITWGAGSIGSDSISTLVKDFRKLTDDPNSKYFVDSNKYTVQEIAEKFFQFIYIDKYQIQFEKWKQKPQLGFMVVGYSIGAGMAEEWMIDINDTAVRQPFLIRNINETGATWNGQPEAISRLLLGFSPSLPHILKSQGLTNPQIDQIIKGASIGLNANFITPPMPIQDAIDLAKFFVDVTEKFTKFAPGAKTVGGPIEVAAITKHEGFKWICRKLYYVKEMNP
jgi:hypothetical protein